MVARAGPRRAVGRMFTGRRPGTGTRNPTASSPRRSTAGADSFVKHFTSDLASLQHAGAILLLHSSRVPTATGGSPNVRNHSQTGSRSDARPPLQLGASHG